MSPDENKNVVRGFLEQVVSTGNVDRIDEFVAEDYVEIFDGERHELGVEGARNHVLGVRETYEGLTIKVGRQIAEGEWVATSITARGTHVGSWLGIKPTGKPVTFAGVNINRVVDGRIVEHGGAANMLGPLLEIGAIEVVGRDEGE